MRRFSVIAATTLLSAIAFGQEPAPPPETTPPADATQPPASQPPASTAPSDSAPASVASIFEALDKDKNGSIAQPEAQAHPTVAQNFAKADANSDGMLSREEFMATFRGQ